MEQLFYNSDEVAQMLGISKSKAYAIIRSLNDELKEKGLLVIHGKVNKKYFSEKIYGYDATTKA